ncbi:2-C-methyl-D-erythritol 4-phosphate cytidylyltransferase [Bacillaceae bacterium Marseille-Q3522]|nr:2-C-methyl-D-erythritol 4-phosphate cytidylyltransferase [Bacillaceae bacterium Marseille-Q3522]
MTYQVIIPAAGQGKRMGAGKNKLLLELGQLPVFIHTMRIFENDPSCTKIFLAIHPDDKTELSKLIKKFHLKKETQIIAGGKERQHSVYNALKHISGDGIVLVHDGARPFVDQEYIHRLVDVAGQKGAAILAVPVKDTIKKVSELKVTETVERANLWSVQTPQAFRISLLKEAHKEAEEDSFLGTDDASLIERLGKEVFIVEGDYDNIKLTTPEDLYFAEAILRQRRSRR